MCTREYDGELIDVRDDDGKTRFFLEGKEIQPGDVLEGHADGKWHLVRFEPASSPGPDQPAYRFVVLPKKGSPPPPRFVNVPAARWPRSFVLLSDNGTFVKICKHHWVSLRRLARVGGFSLPQDADVFSRSEAQQLARAVESLLPDLANPESVRGKTRTTPLEVFAGKHRGLGRFVEFFRLGAFGLLGRSNHSET